MTLNVRGIQELQRRLEGLTNRLSELQGKNEVPLKDLLTPEFVGRHSAYHSIEELFASGGFKAEIPAEFKALPKDELDSHIKKTTSFSTWDDMLKQAGKEWLSRQILS